jgi:hypothetical protein
MDDLEAREQAVEKCEQAVEKNEQEQSAKAQRLADWQKQLQKLPDELQQ